MTYWPDHFGPHTWFRCIWRDPETGAQCERGVDPWDHNTRCPEHRPDPDTIPVVVRHVRVGR